MSMAIQCFWVIIWFIALVTWKTSLTIIFWPTNQIMNLDMRIIYACILKYSVAAGDGAQITFTFSLCTDNIIIITFLQGCFMKLVIFFEKIKIFVIMIQVFSIFDCWISSFFWCSDILNDAYWMMVPANQSSIWNNQFENAPEGWFERVWIASSQ